MMLWRGHLASFAKFMGFGIHIIHTSLIILMKSSSEIRYVAVSFFVPQHNPTRKSLNYLYFMLSIKARLLLSS